MWELSQIVVLRTNFKIVETHTCRKFFLFPYAKHTLVFTSKTISDEFNCKSCNNLKFIAKSQIVRVPTISNLPENGIER